MTMIRRMLTVAAPLAALALAATPALAQGAPGVTSTEITLGNIMPYSGPASSYGTIGKTEAAYLNMINDQGGVNGRKIKFISLDDGYNPSKTKEDARRLVEQDNVFFIFNSLGTPTNSAIHQYMNDHKVPQLFVATGAAKWNDPKHFPWTMGWQPSYQIEAEIYAKYILQHLPNAKIAVLYQNDDFGKDYLIGLKKGLGSKAASMIIATKSYEVTDPTINSQIAALKASGADVLLDATVPKFAAQAIREVYDLGWKPTHFLTNVSASIGAALKPAGLDKSKGLITAAYLRDPTDPQWHDGKGYKDWLAFMQKYYPSGNLADANNVYGYLVSETLIHVLKACGNDLTRENVMKQASHIHDLGLGMLLPGIAVSTSPTDYAPIKQMQLSKFDGMVWKLFGEVISAGPSS